VIRLVAKNKRLKIQSKYKIKEIVFVVNLIAYLHKLKVKVGEREFCYILH